MKARTLREFLLVHSWVGIVSGVLLFVAFYAGALSMFAPEITQWARAEPQRQRQGASQDADALMAAFFARHPQAGNATLVLATAANPAPYVRWGGRGQAAQQAELDSAGALRTLPLPQGAAGSFVDHIHRKGGLPLPRDWAEPVIGVVSLLYALALVSGVIVLLPSLVKDLFVVRFGKNAKRLWLDLHNLLGITSLPFHVVMALSAAVFCLHDWIYDAQGALIYPQGLHAVERAAQPQRPPVTLERTQWRTPTQLAQAAQRHAGDFQPATLTYRNLGTPRASVFVAGTEDLHFKRRPREALALLDPASGALLQGDMLPGQGSSLSRTLVSFFALHFGSYGGLPVRLLYAVLGVMGALLFYTGNVLWIESRSKRLRGSAGVQQPRHVRVLAALNLGLSLGCVAGLALALVAARWLSGSSLAPNLVLNTAYFATLAACSAWALARGAGRGATGLLAGAALAMALIPLTSAMAPLLANLWPGTPDKPYGQAQAWVDGLSAAGSLLLAWMAWRTARRVPMAEEKHPPSAKILQPS